MPLHAMSVEQAPVDDFTPLIGHRKDYGSDEASNLRATEEGQQQQLYKGKGLFRCGALLLSSCVCTLCLIIYVSSRSKATVPLVPPPFVEAAWSSKADPFSYVNPVDLGFLPVNRPLSSRPGEILSNLVTKDSVSGAPLTPLPTNAWYQNLILGSSNTDPENKVFQVPYVVDTAGVIPGVRTHPCYLEANDRTVLMNFEPQNGVTLGAVEKLMDQHYVHKHSEGKVFTISKLAIELEWVSEGQHFNKSGQLFRSPIVRGSPYTSMKYFKTTPRLYAERALRGKIIVDNDESKHSLVCGKGRGVYSAEPVLVQRELKFAFDTSDMTWLVFVSEPTLFECSGQQHDPADDPYVEPGRLPVLDFQKASFFDLRATKPMSSGMVRIAMANNCTTGQNPITCSNRQARDQSDFEKMLRDHAEIYPTSQADIEFSFPIYSSEEEELRLYFNWRPMTMSSMAFEDPNIDAARDPIPQVPSVPKIELLMYALPHQQERMRPIVGSTNSVQKYGCQANLHGIACPALGSSWSLVEHLHRTSFSAQLSPRSEMIPAIKRALQKDILFEPPPNYMAGQGDTYFSGKILAKLGRILIIANEVGGVSPQAFRNAVTRLREGVEIWLNGSAASSMLYDRSWGGIIMCGCNYFYDEVEKKTGCYNKFPDCPAITDPGQNFGAGYYNDHHYHFGYHIYAAAVVAKFDPFWGRKYYQHVMMLVRDISNPSDDDKYFPTWRHKDWYLGWSWASGIVTIGGKPYPNGRNQESVSEAISAYEAVALYGEVMSDIFDSGDDTNQVDAQLMQTASRVKDMGRLLMATEIRSAKVYWHVQASTADGVARIYPEAYRPKVIGMVWSMLAQLQTWFGNEQWKSYGIQLMPITPASELRDSGTWLTEMLPEFTDSCFNDENCKNSGWAVLVYTCLSFSGEHWKEAWAGIDRLDDEAFLDAGGNGHSVTNSLWYISTRPDTASTTDPEEEEAPLPVVVPSSQV